MGNTDLNLAKDRGGGEDSVTFTEVGVEILEHTQRAQREKAVERE